ncbi:MAG: DNA polymerase III subunit delta' [Parcubacteria group bacterium]|nr:DNA polymerase III subunit delta' [Parcubacteria group bacterium]
MNFYWDLCGHENIVKFLQQCIADQRLAHAYLFSGAPHSGKRKLAEELILSLYCESDTRPCRQCRLCHGALNRTHPDIIWIEPEEEAKHITIDQTREFISRLNKKSWSDGWKIGVISAVEKMNKNAANCLLKTLEEPSPKTTILLIASSANLALKTIQSRCQLLTFQPVTEYSIENYLKEKGCADDMAKTYARLSQGRPGKALQFFKDPELFDVYQARVKEILDLFGADVYLKFRFTEQFDTPDKASQMIGDCIDVARDVLCYKSGKDSNFCQEAYRDRFKLLSSQLSFLEIKDLMSFAFQALHDLKQNVNTKLTLQNLLMKFK